MRWNEFKGLLRNPLGAAGLFFIVSSFVVAILAYQLAPDDTPNANQMNLALANKPPGFTVDILHIPLKKVNSGFWDKLKGGQVSKTQQIAVSNYSISEEKLRYQVYTGSGTAPRQHIELNTEYGNVYVEPKTFYLGTDKYGRDLLSRLFLGSRISFTVGFISVLISLVIGIPLGLWAGYYGGWLDKLIMWLVNVVWSIPTLLLVIAITLALGKGFWQVFIAVGCTMWVEVARVVRGQVKSIREKEFIQAAKMLALSDFRVMFRHILPNVIAPVIVISSANFASAILIESGLSFLGIGAQPPIPSWGGMIKDHYAYLVVGKAYLAIAPGMAIMLLVLSFMMVGNALRDVLDVKS